MKFLITRWTVWEYLPWWLANGPVYLMYTWFALRARHFFFFTNVDPAIPFGGALGESKHEILQLLPPRIVPKTVFIRPGEDFGPVLERLGDAGIGFPLIAKPDVGERGFLVRKIHDPETLQSHLERHPVAFIVQEFLPHPIELSVLFYRFPDGGPFGISSVCIKEFLAVTGDGKATVRQLMERNARSAFQLERFEKEFPEILAEIPGSGQVRMLEPIGNHARGTKFLNGNHLINPDLLRAFEPVCREVEGVLYGRFDLKCDSPEDLHQGIFKVMELNGVLGEPAHIYDPEYGMWRAYRDFYRQWRLIYRLHRAQKERGIRPTPVLEGFRIMRDYFRYKRRLSD